MAAQPGISNAAACDGNDAILARLDAGSGPGKLRIYEGTMPATTDDPITDQTLLAELTLSDPAFGASVDANPGAIATANLINNDPSANANGTPSFFIGYDSDDNPVIRGTAGVADADLILTAATISSGVEVGVSSWTVTHKEQ